MDEIKIIGLEYCIGDIYLVDIKFLYVPTGREKYWLRPCILIGIYDGTRPLFVPITRTVKPLRNSRLDDNNLNEVPSYLNDNFTLLSIQTGRPTTMKKMEKWKVGRVSDESVKQIIEYIKNNNKVFGGIKHSIGKYLKYKHKMAKLKKVKEPKI